MSMLKDNSAISGGMKALAVLFSALNSEGVFCVVLFHHQHTFSSLELLVRDARIVKFAR